MTRKPFLILAGGAAAFAGASMLWSKKFWPWQQTWGATEDELLRRMPGDELVPFPDYLTTRAITVSARPEHIYPWLAQMGYQRGGLYSYDFLDRLFGILDRPSAREIMPEFQDLKAGDIIPVGKGGDFPVADLKKDEFLLLAGDSDGAKWTWSTAFYPTEDGRTRLVTRNTGKGGPFSRKWFMSGMDLAAFIMVWRWLHVLKGRAEGLAATEAASPETVRAFEPSSPG